MKDKESETMEQPKDLTSNDVAAKEHAQSGKQQIEGSDCPPDGPSALTSASQSKRFNTQFHQFRYIIIIMCGFAMGTMLLLRTTIAVAMISMVNRTALYIQEHPNASEQDMEDFFPPGHVETGDFVWPNEVQQTIMSGYMVAYTIPQYFTTRLTMRFGTRSGIPVCLILCAVGNLLTPILSFFGWQFTLALRLANGLGASAILPCMISVIESWVPRREHGKGVALFQFVHCSIYASTPLISGYLTSFHWKWAFYIPSIWTIFFSLLWWVVITEKPESSQLLSQKELDLINRPEEELDRKTGVSKVVEKSDERFNLPWYFMFKLKEYYFLSLIWCCQCACISGFLFLMPSYLNRVLQIPIEEVGKVNFYVQIGTIFSALWPTFMWDFLQNRFNLSLSASRSIIVFICEFFTSATLAYLALFHDDLIITIGINRFFQMTVDTLHLYTVMSQFGHAGLSGFVYSMVNTVGNFTLVLFSWAMGRFLDYSGESLTCWSWIFVIMIILNITFFVLYATLCPSTPVQVLKKKKGEIEESEKKTSKD